MNVTELKKSGLIIFETITGSVAYNLNTPKSDTDMCGIFKLPKEQLLSIIPPAQIIGDSTQDTKYYELKKFIELAKDCNPNIIELLFMPDECVKICNPTMRKLIENRSLFVSQKAYYTFSGYAYAQIKKAKGQHKLINNPWPKEVPRKEDYCWVIPLKFMSFGKIGFDVQRLTEDVRQLINTTAARPIELNKLTEDKDLLKYCHVSSLEHVPNVYRLYFYGKSAKGVFRGDGMLVCESIPLQDENEKFVGLLIYNEQEYEKALKGHKQYWDWVAIRNENRWVDQENNKVDFDSKNLMHCMRLLYSGEQILVTGEPIIRFEGHKRDTLMAIRNGEYSYDEIMRFVEDAMTLLEDIKTNSQLLPHSPDIKRIDRLYKELLAG